MEAISNAKISPQIKEHIRARDLLTAFNQRADQIKFLSLDCFDTLLWRKTIEPKDVFFDMQRRPAFQSLGISAINRIDAEYDARTVMYMNHGHYEVNLHDIYRTGFPSLTEDQIAALIEEEILAEIEACYAYPPIIGLIRQAYARNIKIVIVSNTYLRKNQLERLLASVLPDDVKANISQVFCSCEYLQSKTGALFKQVLGELNTAPQTILHLGDNQEADLDAPKFYGLQALHLVQFNKIQMEYLRLQNTCAVLNDTSVHHVRSMASPFRGLLSSAELATDKPESVIGYMSLGPIMYTFARYLVDEIKQLKATNKSLKVLFMMRDAYLPALACEALLGESVGTYITISRFCATAAAFRSREDIITCMGGVIDSGEFEEACKQLLLPKNFADSVIANTKAAKDPRATFCQLILQDDVINYVVTQSKAFWTRLKKYLEKTVDIKPGDTLMLIDLGYAGRSQRWLTPILKNELHVDVTGRYLIALNTFEWQKTRRGLIDHSWCDDRTMEALKLGNSLLEELCCSAGKSVVDYDNEGNPIFTRSNTQKTQHERTELIQAEALRFVREAKDFFKAVQSDFPLTMLRDVTLAELMRRTYFPLQMEINYLQDYRHDVNLGSDSYFNAVEKSEEELISLRRQGLWFKNQNMYGLRTIGFELTLALLSKHRYGFPVFSDDLTFRQEDILVMQSHGQTLTKKMLPAVATHDGYFSLWLVVDNIDMQLAILFGLNYQLVQIECVDITPKAYFLTEKQGKYVQDISDHVFLNQIIKKEQDLYECTEKTGSLIIPLQANANYADQSVLRIVFRPIVKRINQ